MARKGYWVSVYRAIHNQEQVGKYAQLAGPALGSLGRNISCGRLPLPHMRRVSRHGPSLSSSTVFRRPLPLTIAPIIGPH